MSVLIFEVCISQPHSEVLFADVLCLGDHSLGSHPVSDSESGVVFPVEVSTVYFLEVESLLWSVVAGPEVDVGVFLVSTYVHAVCSGL